VVTQWNLGKHLSEEHRRKDRGSHKGKHHTEESKRKMSILRKGNNNPNWKGGIHQFSQKIRNCDKSIEWRIKVFERDNYTCRNKRCNKHGNGNIHAHHIISFYNLMLLL